jgi:hypothetical protein
MTPEMSAICWIDISIADASCVLAVLANGLCFVAAFMTNPNLGCHASQKEPYSNVLYIDDAAEGRRRKNQINK